MNGRCWDLLHEPSISRFNAEKSRCPKYFMWKILLKYVLRLISYRNTMKRAWLQISAVKCSMWEVVDILVFHVPQTYDCMIYRHGNMLVGRTGSGKTVAWRALQGSWGQLKDEGLEGWVRVWVYIMNSLALSNDEIYGCTSKVQTLSVNSQINWILCN